MPTPILVNQDNGEGDRTLIKPAIQTNQLVVRIELDNGIILSIDQDKLPMNVGRGPDCDIRIPQGSVSRHHCELFVKNNILFLKDTSANGTLVGGKRIRGESVSIESATKIVFAEDAIMTVIPSGLGDETRVMEIDSDRREADRRQSKRRSNVYVVDFERRSDTTRRVCQRRVASL